MFWKAKKVTLIKKCKVKVSKFEMSCIFSCIIQGRLDEEPSTIAFQPSYEQGSLLTIVCIKIELILCF